MFINGKTVQKFKQDKYISILLVIVCLPAIFYLLKPGFYEPHDLHHVADIYQMVRAIKSGQIPPRWGPDFSFGYGYPLYNFYYVLPFYLGSLFFTLVHSLTLSLKLVMIFGVLASGFGMYLYLRQLLGKFASFVGAILFIYTPYRAVEVYVRGAIGEVACLALMPFVAWSFVRLIKKPTKAKIGLSAIITSLFILSHNYLSFLSFPIIIVSIVPFVWNKNIFKKIFSLVTPLVISLFISAYWWLPAIIEQNLLRSQTPFPLIDHFPFLKQLIIPYWGYGASVWGPGDELSFQIGLVNLAVVAIAVSFVTLFKSKVKKSFKLAITVLLVEFIFLVVFMNVRTYPIWKLLPFYDFIQFPWRLLFFTTFITSVLAGIIVEVVGSKYKVYLGIGIILASLVLTYGYFKPSKVVNKIDNQYLSRFFANRQIDKETTPLSQDYLEYSEDYLLLPKWVNSRPSELPKSKIEALGDAEILQITENNPVDWNADIRVNSNSIIRFNTYYFPGWKAKIDGENAKINIGESYGEIEILVNEGDNKVEFYWSETPLRRNTDVLSILGLLVAGLLLIKPREKQ